MRKVTRLHETEPGLQNVFLPFCAILDVVLLGNCHPFEFCFVAVFIIIVLAFIVTLLFAIIILIFNSHNFGIYVPFNI